MGSHTFTLLEHLVIRHTKIVRGSDRFLFLAIAMRSLKARSLRPEGCASELPDLKRVCFLIFYDREVLLANASFKVY